MTNKVWILFQYDGYDYTGMVRVFSHKDLAELALEAYNKSDDGQWYSHYIKEVEVHDGTGPLPSPWDEGVYSDKGTEDNGND